MLPLILCLAIAPQANSTGGPVDLSAAVVHTTGNPTRIGAKAVEMLVDEVEKRSGIRWKVMPKDEPGGAPIIVVGMAGHFHQRSPVGPEGYNFQLGMMDGKSVLRVLGSDERGVLYGVGRLLRILELEPGRIRLHRGLLPGKSEPRDKIRGHQLGYRPKTNSYDGWSLAQWEQYLRDLIIFGCNAIELIPPRSDDAATSPHFPLPAMRMMIGMSKLCADYGLDVWIWYPALDKDYGDPKQVEFALKEWGEVFRQLPRVDAVFVPGGDPGHTRPKSLMALLEKQTANLRRYHPKAQMWVSPQSFDRTWMEEFLGIVREKPSWLGGIVFGPQVRLTLPELRKAVPASIPIRHYPDITHSLRCQYPVADWDPAFAVTLSREPINPRPRAMAQIYRATQPYTIGSITYSEGCNDDVNKAIWSGLGWDPNAKPEEILRDYSRYFIGARYAESFAQGLLSLERNWDGPVATNSGIDSTLAQLQAIERQAGPRERLNWRWQQAMYRAYYDAFVRQRAIYEAGLEAMALDQLRQAKRRGSLLAMAEAEATLEKTVAEPIGMELRARVFELAEALFQSIRMQLSVERYQAISVGRGANLDLIDVPLNNRIWLKDRFALIREKSSEQDRLREIANILNWSNPGPGGFYDDLGNPQAQPHLANPVSWLRDPSGFKGSFSYLDDPPLARLSWRTQAIGLYESPVQLKYLGLDRRARYKVRVVYGSGPVRLVAQDRFEIHPPLSKRYEVLEFAIPHEATSGGELDLKWFGPAANGGPGRGCQVAEVWLVLE